MSSSGKQPSGPAPFIRRWSQTRLTKPGGTKPEALGRGRGIMSVIGEVARESHCSALPRVVIQHGLGRARCRYGGARACER